MKKLLLPIALLGILNAKAQTIDTTKINGVAVSKIATPFATKWNDTTKARYIGVQIVSDNLKSGSVFVYTLYAASGKSLDNGIVECKGDDYTGWTGDNKFPFSFVATKLGIAIK